MIEKGNVILPGQEIAELRSSILNRFHLHTGARVHEHELNSTIKSYDQLFQNIQSQLPSTLIESLSQRTLVSIFHKPKNESESSKAFRRKAINALYQYAYGCSREEFLTGAHDARDTITSRQLKNLRGYWQAYYTKENPLLGKIGGHETVTIGINIAGDSLKDVTVTFVQGDGCGKGTMEIIGSNIVFQFRNEKNNLPAYLLVNCGSRYIHELENHIQFAKGVCSFIDETGMPVTATCVMEYFSDDKFKEIFKLDPTNLCNEAFKSIFNTINKKSNSNSALISQFHELTGMTGSESIPSPN